MRHLMHVLIVLAAANWAHVVFAQSDVEKMVAESDLAIQKQIRTTVMAFLADGRSESEVRTSWRGFRELTKLKELENEEAELIKQLAVYAVGEQSEREPKVLEADLVLQMLSFNPSIPIRVLAPYLDADDKRIREFALDWFQRYDSGGSNRAVLMLMPESIKQYTQYVTRRLHADGQQVPHGFVEYLYQRSPHDALHIFYSGNRAQDMIPMLEAMSKNLQARRQQMRADEKPLPQANSSSGNLARLEAVGRKLADAQERADILEQVEIPKPRKPDREVLLTAQTVKNATWLHENKFDEQFQQALPEAQQELKKLAEHDQWWARLYVAEIMRRHRELRDPNVLDKLRDDENELVSKTAKSIRQ